jgi:hypothetical protein
VTTKSIVHKTATELGVGKDAGTVKTWSGFSTAHLRSAVFFSQKARELEALVTADQEKFLADEFNNHRSYVVGAIFASVAYLECLINEIFADTTHGRPFSHFGTLDVITIQKMALLWTYPRFGRSETIMEKYQIALELANRTRFPKKHSQFSDAAILIELRNALMHYKPEWIATISADETEGGVARELHLRLKNKFSLNPVMPPMNPFFPDKCLSAGCARWSVITVVEFVDEFSKQMGMAIRFFKPISDIVTST